tara:strand:+ start:19795 stop:21123 length:1329 start_codon:yes stop_codon:yes gene_type:complete
MTLKRINRVRIGKLAGTPVFDKVENFANADMVGTAYKDLEITDATTVELTSPQIEITGQRGDGQTPPGVDGYRDGAPSLAFYMRGLDLSGGAAHGVDAATAVPQYDMLLEQATGGTVRNIAGEDVVGGSTEWILQFGGGRVAAVGYQVGDMVGWVNASGKMECLPVVEIGPGADQITVAGHIANGTGGFSAAPQAGDDIYGMRSYPVDQTAGARPHIAVHAQLAQSGVERFVLGCMGSISFSDADGLLVATWAAQAQDWKTPAEITGEPTFSAFVAPNLGPVSTRGARVIICADKNWGVDGAGAHSNTDVAIATAISGSMDLATDIQPRTAATGNNGRQGFVAVQNTCNADLRLYHDGTTANLLAGASQTFGDGALLQFMGDQTTSIMMQFGDQPGNTVVLEIPCYQANAVLGEEGGLATIDLTGRGFRPEYGTATATVHLL